MRCRIVARDNLGKVVVVVRRYFGESINDCTWPLAVFPWVVTSLCGPLRSYYVHSGMEAPPAMTIVVDDRDLVPLRDDDEGFHVDDKVPEADKTTATLS
jgi:hypothetical protein